MMNIFRKKRNSGPGEEPARAAPVGPVLIDPHAGEPASRKMAARTRARVEKWAGETDRVEPRLRAPAADETLEPEPRLKGTRAGNGARPAAEPVLHAGNGLKRAVKRARLEDADERPATARAAPDPAEPADADEELAAVAAPPPPSPEAAPEEAVASLEEAESQMPRFRAPPPDPNEERSAVLGRVAGDTQARLWEAFTPTKPKRWSRCFAGRRWAIQRIITAIEEEQAHVVIFGARGIGKTSLANVLAESANEVEYQVLRCPCSADITFEEIFRGFLRNLPSEYMDRSARGKNPAVVHFEQLLPRGSFGPTELTEALSYLKLEHVILIIDEFDRVESETLKNQLAEAIKNLTDISARITVIIVGIARTLEELLGKHQSIQRHLVAVHLPLMEPAELRALVQVGEEGAGVRFDEATRETIVSFAKGLPYYAQLMCLYAGRHALGRGSTRVEMTDLKEALAKVLDEADPLTIAAYETAVRGKRKEFMADVLFVAARSRFDKFGTFTAAEAAEVVLGKDGRTIPELTLHRAFSTLALREYGPMLEKQRTPAGIMKYSFANQTMRQYILVRQARQRGLI